MGLTERAASESRCDVNIKRQSAFARTAPYAELRLGFVPLTDCAPLVMAHELGMFRRHGLRVRLRRELGWASVRDKIVQGELDAAHALAAMPLEASLGLGSPTCDCLTGLTLNLNGNAITLSSALWRHGVRDARTLRAEIARSRRERTLTFGTVFAFSSHHYLLCKWLTAAGIQPGRDVRLVIMPPAQMVVNLQSGNLDGFCVGEPWSSLAVKARAGWCVAVSADLDPGHPEKVLMVRRDFAEKREAEHLALLASLIEACKYCAAPQNQEEIIATLSRAEYVGVPIAVLRRGLRGPFDFGQGDVRTVQDFCIFHGQDVNDPSPDKAAWALNLVRSSGSCPDSAALTMVLGQRVYRSDIFHQARQLYEQHIGHDAPEPTNDLVLA